MNQIERRLARLEATRQPVRQTAITFVPIGIAGTDAEASYLAAERVRLGIEPRDRLLSFSWGEAQP